MTEVATMFDPLAPDEAASAGTTPEPEREAWCPILPVPIDAPKAKPHPRLGRPSSWRYRDRDGRTLGYICRFDEGRCGVRGRDRGSDGVPRGLGLGGPAAGWLEPGAAGRALAGGAAVGARPILDFAVMAGDNTTYCRFALDSPYSADRGAHRAIRALVVSEWGYGSLPLSPPHGPEPPDRPGSSWTH